jgi:transposase
MRKVELRSQATSRTRSGRLLRRSFRRRGLAGKRRTDMRAVVNGLMYILSTGCQWRSIPKDFPPRSTVYNYIVWWQCDRVLDRIHHALYVECREGAEWYSAAGA